ncbi:hypothetical protein AMAG_07813 [Allomyces macrogynus ATCC 38327]|uniref:Uncharacterized protein n=1 Tax=Allomyces macrogynus (strain ATCC 38327) TaxID=578462 RepID=A0A0L0SJD2_ALLM3|nr:hypothetical protein AMAG_07813 [Allomyces macrogynus ATCC 38327]|eukprot:KNE62611.1 hypothetical protein AMAG_07813 [Allomyces macrogynus ATCC 38327]
MTTTFNSYATAVAAVNAQTNPATHARYRSLANGQSFADLDDYVSTTLPAVVLGDANAANGETSAGQGHLTLDQLAAVMAWKLMRGKYRATLMGLIRSNDPATVIDVTTRAVQHLRVRQEQSRECGSKDEVASLMAVVMELTAVRGVGPATATAIASFLDPDAPFMSDELLAAARIKAPKYSLAEYERVVAYLDAIRAGKQSHPAMSVDAGAGGDASTMSRRDMERAIWAHIVLKKQHASTEATSTAARPAKKPAKRTRSSTANVADDAPAAEDHGDDDQEPPARRAPPRRRAVVARSGARASPPSVAADPGLDGESAAAQGTARQLRPRRGASRPPGA